MASMNFDNETIQTLMVLVDDNKEELKEADYVKICNAMKFLHDRYQHPPLFTQDQPFVFVGNPPFNPTQNSPPLFTQNSTPLFTQNSTPSPDIRLIGLQAHITECRNILRGIGTGRVTYEDKIRFCTSLLDSHYINIPPTLSGGAGDRYTAHHLVNMVKESLRMSNTVLLRGFQEKRDERIQRKRAETQAKLTRLEAELALYQTEHTGPTL